VHLLLQTQTFASPVQHVGGSMLDLELMLCMLCVGEATVHEDDN
jgi:hypothetical protein